MHRAGRELGLGRRVFLAAAALLATARVVSCSDVPVTGITFECEMHGAACDDGDSCTTGERCVGGRCAGGSAMNCDDGNVCTSDKCEKAWGCLHGIRDVPCSDGDACTGGDKCNGDTCASTPVVCDDGDACSLDTCDAGSGCDHSQDAVQCDDATACTADSCVAVSGCLHAPNHAACDDSNPCTTDTCDEEQGCTHAGIVAPCTDHDLCTKGDACKASKCVGVTVDCDDDDACTTDTCKTSAGCTHKDIAAQCKDANECTSDFCDKTKGCVYTPNGAACEDGNPCTEEDECVGGACKAGPYASDSKTCTDGDVCTVSDACTKGLCKGVFKAECDDGNACTKDDQCAGGVCNGTSALSCGDSNPCTTDICNASTGCVNQPNSVPCNDGNLCTIQDVCKASTCQGGKAKNCDDGNSCTADACTSAEGCVHAPATASCEDGNKCTLADACEKGACVSGQDKLCEGGNLCKSGCVPTTGQCFTGKAADGTACQNQGKCLSGVCMVPISEGSFWMGCNAAKHKLLFGSCQYSQLPQHEVWLSAFTIGLHEVTVEQYSECVQAGVCQSPYSSSSYEACNWGVNGREKHPVNCIPRPKALAYCKWLDPAADLPSEAQWEKAARGGCEFHGGASNCKESMPTFPWGEAYPSCAQTVMGDYSGPIGNFVGGCGKAHTWPILSKPLDQSPYGVHDVAGNVMEWTRDSWSTEFYGKSPAKDPVNKAVGSGVVRGGHWGSEKDYMAPSYRGHLSSNETKHTKLGFRCVR